MELKQDDTGIYMPQYQGYYHVTPIEYKRGKPKEDNSDIFQLLAEVCCLEEMLATQIEKGYLFYFETRRREEIQFSQELRRQLKDNIMEMHSYMERGYTPKVKVSNKCKSCSLKNICLPKLSENKEVEQYIHRRILE